MYRVDFIFSQTPFLLMSLTCALGFQPVPAAAPALLAHSCPGAGSTPCQDPTPSSPCPFWPQWPWSLGSGRRVWAWALLAMTPKWSLAEDRILVWKSPSLSPRALPQRLFSMSRWRLKQPGSWRDLPLL